MKLKRLNVTKMRKNAARQVPDFLVFKIDPYLLLDYMDLQRELKTRQLKFSETMRRKHGDNLEKCVAYRYEQVDSNLKIRFEAVLRKNAR